MQRLRECWLVAQANFDSLCREKFEFEEAGGARTS